MPKCHKTNYDYYLEVQRSMGITFIVNKYTGTLSYWYGVQHLLYKLMTFDQLSNCVSTDLGQITCLRVYPNIFVKALHINNSLECV